MSLKVAELVADLGLDDNLTKPLKKAEANFKDTADGMDADAQIDLDVSRMMRKLDQMEAEVKDTTAMIDRETPRIDGSKLGDGIRSGLGKAEGAVSQAGAKMGDLLTAGIAGGAALGGALVVEAFGKSLEREAGTAKLGIQLGLPPEMAKAAGARAGAVYAQGFGENVGDVNDAVRFISQNMGGLGTMSADEFDEMTKGVLTLADSFDQDLNKVTAAAGTLMKSGLAKNGKEALDLLARGLASPANKADDLLDTFIEYSTVFRQLGINGPQALGLLMQGLGGAARDGDTVADTLKGLVDMASAGSNDTMAAYSRLGLSYSALSTALAAGGPPAADALQQVTTKLAGVENPGERAKLAIALFGDKAVDMQGALDRIDLSKAVTEVGNVEGAMNRATTATDTQSSRIEAWKRSMESNVVDFIDRTAIPALGRLADKYHEIFGEDSGENLRRGAAILNGQEPGGDGKPWWDLSKILQFDTGGVVPGPVGQPRIVMAHGGETILPTHKAGALTNPTPAGPNRSGRRRETTIIRFGTAEVARQERIHDRAWS